MDRELKDFTKSIKQIKRKYEDEIKNLGKRARLLKKVQKQQEMEVRKVQVKLSLQAFDSLKQDMKEMKEFLGIIPDDKISENLEELDV